MKRLMSLFLAALLLSAWVWFFSPISSAAAPAHRSTDPTPPSQPVKLIFIHHSTGGNWLADPSENDLGGGLGRALMENNYYVSGTNYGWGPDSIGDATDIPNCGTGSAARTAPPTSKPCITRTARTSAISAASRAWPMIPAGKMSSLCSNPVSPIPTWKGIRTTRLIPTAG